MARNNYLRHGVRCPSCGWEGIRKDAGGPCAKCQTPVVAVTGNGGRTHDMPNGTKRPQRGKARTFGQDLMRGEHVVGQGKNARRDGDGQQTNDLRGGKTHRVTTDPYRAPDGEATAATSGTSIFDPVLCELVYRWFCPPGGLVLDPFAGGSVRGIVASKLGREYFGIDLREEQVNANYEQSERICGDVFGPQWEVGDSLDVLARSECSADLVFSCPPYADLEVYSDDPRDLSTMGYPQFRATYEKIIALACARLKPDRFACFVVGDARGPDGSYYGLPWHTIAAFEAAGLRLYNEAVLVTAIGSLPVRARKQFEATRKLGKTHQNVLVFVKGDARKATAAVGAVDFGEAETFTDEREAPSAAAAPAPASPPDGTHPAAAFGTIL